MGRFYLSAILVVLTLVFAPVLLLSLRHEDRFEGKVVLYNSYPAKAKSLDMATCGDTISAALQAQVYEPLYAYHYLKRPVELIADVAEDMPSMSADGLTCTIRIRKGIRYAPNPCFGLNADGSPRTRSVRAEDFVLSFKRAADFHIQTPMAWTFLSGRIRGLDGFRAACEKYREGDFSRYDLPVEGIRALDEHTLEMRLTNPYPQLVHVLAMHCYSAMPREVIDYYLTREPLERRTAQITRPEQMVGTGAFRVSEWNDGGRIVFERNPVYDHGVYPAEGAPGDEESGLLVDAGKPLPFIDVICYEYIAEDLPMWLGFLSRQYDVSAIPRDVFGSVIGPDRGLLEKWAKRGIRLVKFTDPSVFWYAFNMEDPLFGTSKSLRQAMSLGFNADDYIEVLFNGRGKRPTNILPDSFPCHDEAGASPYSRFDPEAARAKLEAARGELARAGLLDRDGNIPQITVDLGGRDEFARSSGEFTQRQFERLGLRVKIELNDWPTLQQKVHNKQVQVYGMGWHADYPDPENFLQLFYGPNIEKGTNNTNYRNPEFDALYDRVKVMNDSPERRELYVKMVQILNEDCPVILTVEPESFLLVHDWVKNQKRHPFGYGMSKYLRIDVEERRRMGGR